MKRLRPGIKFFLLSFLLSMMLMFLTTGCWGARETDQMAFILVMGIDKGQNNLVQVTFQIAIPQAIGGKDGGKPGESTEIISVEAASLFGALQLANAFVSRELTFIHNKVVIVSEDIAREGMAKYINPLVRSREIRRTTFLMVSKGKAREFIEKNKPILEKSPSRQFETFMQANFFTGFLPYSIIHEFYKNIKSPGSQPFTNLVGVEKEENLTNKKPGDGDIIKNEVAYLPGEIPRKGGNKIEIIGLAVFRDDKLVGFLNGAETRYHQMITGNFRSAIFTFPDPQRDEKNNIIVIKINKGRSPDIKVTFPEDKPHIEVKLILEGEILSIQSGINYEATDKIGGLQSYIEKLISSEALKMIKKTQQEFKSDICGFGEYTRKYFWTWKEWEEFNWLKRYPEADVKVTTELAIRRTGLMSKTAPTHSGGED